MRTESVTVMPVKFRQIVKRSDDFTLLCDLLDRVRDSILVVLVT